MNESALAAWVVNNRLKLACISLVAGFILSLGVLRLDFIHDYRIFFHKDDPFLNDYLALNETYTSSDSVIFVVRSVGDVFARERLDAVGRITDAAWQMPYASRVDSIVNFVLSESEEDTIKVYPLYGDLDQIGETEVKRRATLALNTPMVVGALVSPDRRTTIIDVKLELPAESGDATALVTDEARRIASGAERRYPDLEIYLYGTAPVDQAFHETTLNDLVQFGPQVLGIILVALLVILRSLVATGALCAVMLVTTGATMGASGWLGFGLNQVTVAVPSIVLVLCVCDGVHLLSSFSGRCNDGVGAVEAMRESVRDNFRPILITSVTTALGLLCLRFSVSPPLSELGTIAAIGVILAYLFTLALVPFIVLLSPRSGAARRGRSHDWMAWLSRGVYTWHSPIMVVGVSISVVFLAMAGSNRFVDSMTEYFAPDVQVRRAADVLRDNLGGVHILRYSLSANGYDGVTDPRFLEKLDQYSKWLNEQKEVVHVHSLSQLMKQLNYNFNGDDPSFMRLPENSALGAQYLFAYELMMPYGVTLEPLLDFKKTQTQIRATINTVKSDEIVALDRRARAWLSGNMPATHAVSASESLLFADLGQRNIEAMFKGSLLALACITLVVMLGLRSLSFGLLSVVPNVLPIGIAFGIWAAFSGEVNLAATIIFSLTLGVIIDDSVHFLTRYVRARARGATVEKSIEAMLTSAGTAVCTTTVVLTLGFLVLVRSDFAVNSLTGWLVSITLVVTLIFDLVFLPALISQYESGILYLARRRMRTASPPDPVRLPPSP